MCFGKIVDNGLTGAVDLDAGPFPRGCGNCSEDACIDWLVLVAIERLESDCLGELGKRRETQRPRRDIR